MPFGEELRRERERRGISLDDVALSTRVALHHLYALEANRFADLPGGVFNRGIVRSYAQYCGLDADGTVQGFLTAARENGVEPEPRDDAWVELAEAVHRNRPLTQPPQRSRWLGVAALVFATLCLALAVFGLLVHRGILRLPEPLQHYRRQVTRLLHNR